MVFLEGIDSSSDRKMFSGLFPEYGSKIKFVPCKTTENLPRMNTAILSILESNLGWMQFYLIRDRDFLTPDIVNKYNQHSSGKMYVLNRYHIENYLLDGDLIAKVSDDIFGKPINPKIVENKLKNIAINISGEFLRDMVAFRLNLIYRPEDFSLGKFMNGQNVFDDSGKWNSEGVNNLKNVYYQKVESINKNLFEVTKPDNIENLIKSCQEELYQAVFGPGDGWKSVLPGRRLLQEYAKLEGLGDPIILQNSLKKELSVSPERVLPELHEVIQKIVQGKLFNQ
jgi:hypothetical protein